LKKAGNILRAGFRLYMIDETMPEYSGNLLNLWQKIINQS